MTLTPDEIELMKNAQYGEVLWLRYFDWGMLRCVQVVSKLLVEGLIELQRQCPTGRSPLGAREYDDLALRMQTEAFWAPPKGDESYVIARLTKKGAQLYHSSDEVKAYWSSVRQETTGGYEARLLDRPPASFDEVDDDQYLAKLAQAYYASEKQSEDNFWAWEKVTELCETDPERAWRVGLYLLEAASTKNEICYFAACVLENLLKHFGVKMLRTMEEELPGNKPLLYGLGAVWLDEERDEAAVPLQELLEKYDGCEKDPLEDYDDNLQLRR